ncbi:MAG: hypothetical protein ACJ07L_14155, partial [Opitutales bacterium]
FRRKHDGEKANYRSIPPYRLDRIRCDEIGLKSKSLSADLQLLGRGTPATFRLDCDGAQEFGFYGGAGLNAPCMVSSKPAG